MIAGPLTTQTIHVQWHRHTQHVWTRCQKCLHIPWWLDRRESFVWLLSGLKSWFPAFAPTDSENSPDLGLVAAKHNLVLILPKKKFSDCGWPMDEHKCVARTQEPSTMHATMCNQVFTSEPLFLFICILFTLFVFHQVFSSSGAKQNAGGGGCHRQIKSLLLMHCSDIEKIEAAPQRRLQLNLEEKASNF